MADIRRLAELGMVPPLAKEVAAQITSGVGDKRRLTELSMVTRLASEVSTQITTKVTSVRRLAELSMPPVLAKELVAQIQGGGGLQPLTGDYVIDFTQMADGAPGLATTGQPTSRDTTSADTKRVTATVSSGALVAPASGVGQSAAYTGVELAEDIKWAYVDYSYGLTDDVFALIATSKVSLALILATSLHVVFNRTGYSVQYFANSGAIQTEVTGSYAAIELGKTVRAGWKIVDSNTLELLLPTGETVTITSPIAISHKNHALVYEHLNPSGAPGIKMLKAYAGCYADPAAAGWTNLFTNQNNLANAAWVKANLQAPVSGQPDASGGTLAERVLETAATGFHSIQQTLTKDATARRYTLRYKVKGVSRDWVIALLGSGGAGYSQYAPISANAVPASTGSFTDKATMSYALGNGFYEIELDFKTGTETSLAMVLGSATGGSAGNASFLGDVTKGLLIYDEWLFERPL